MRDAGCSSIPRQTIVRRLSTCSIVCSGWTGGSRRARPDMDAIWDPAEYPQWQALLERALAEGGPAS